MVPVHAFILPHICPVVSTVYCIGRTLICNYWQVVILLLVRTLLEILLVVAAKLYLSFLAYTVCTAL